MANYTYQQKKVIDDLKKFKDSTIEERASRLKIKKWDVYDILLIIDPSSIRGKGFDLKPKDLIEDCEKFQFSSFNDRARRLNVFTTVVMRMVIDLYKKDK